MNAVSICTSLPPHPQGMKSGDLCVHLISLPLVLWKGPCVLCAEFAVGYRNFELWQRCVQIAIISSLVLLRRLSDSFHTTRSANIDMMLPTTRWMFDLYYWWIRGAAEERIYFHALLLFMCPRGTSHGANLCLSILPLLCSFFLRLNQIGLR